MIKVSNNIKTTTKRVKIPRLFPMRNYEIRSLTESKQTTDTKFTRTEQSQARIRTCPGDGPKCQ